MRDLEVLKARREVASRLGEPPIRDMVPSQRDFLRVVTTGKHGVAFVAVITQEREVQRAVDAAIAGLAAPDALLRLAASVRPPLLALEPCVAKNQVLAARIAGADAVVLPACLPPAELEGLISTVASARMTAVLEVAEMTELALALELRPRAILVSDLAVAREVARGPTILAPAATSAEARELRGVADAALAAPGLVLGGAFHALVQELER